MGARALSATLAAVMLSACAAPRAELPYVQIKPVGHLELQTADAGVASKLLVTTLIEPEGVETIQVLGRREWGEIGDHSLIDLSVRYEDFPGTAPTSSGRSQQEVVEYGADGEARPGQPLARPVTIELDPPRAALARRIHVSGRLFAVDVLEGEGHSGSQVIEFPAVVLESFSRLPLKGSGPGGVQAALRHPDPGELFLAAASTPPSGRPEVVGLLIAELTRLDPGQREAAFGALLYLTGETHGRSEYRWQAWWDSRRRR